jgi:putative transposase
VRAHQAEHAVALMCEVLGLSRSGYYAWAQRGPSARQVQDDVLLGVIREEHLASRGIYGSPRVHAMLKRRGHLVSRKRVARLMRSAGIVGVTRRRWKHGTTVRDKSARPAPDLVDRKFEADGPNRLWVADIKHIPTLTGTLFLASVMDVWSRKVVGWATSTSMPAELVIAALDMAHARRRPGRVVHHSDQGSQYTSLAFTERCRVLGVERSMGSVGDCYDNAMAESLFATVETELVQLVGRLPLEQAEAEVFSFFEGFYNTRRLHSALGQRSPVEFERQTLPQAVNTHPQVASLPPNPPRPSPQLSAGA